jgi:RimJ/RimL family protein N-acetyltransferase
LLRPSRATLEDEGGSLNLAAVLRDGGILVGDVVLFWRSREHRAGEVGFIFHPDHGGRGLATEVTEEMHRLGFEGLGLHRIIGRCDRRNAGSARLMERLGMRREAHFGRNQLIKGEWADELVYALLEEEWQRAKPGLTSTTRCPPTHAEGQLWGAKRRRRPAIADSARATGINGCLPEVVAVGRGRSS